MHSDGGGNHESSASEHHKCARLVSLAFLAAIATAGVGVAPVQAAIACLPGDGGNVYSVGPAKASTQGKEIEGVSGHFEGEALNPCSNGVGSTWLWVAIEGPNSFDIMQIGIGRPNTQTMGWYWTWGRNPDSPGCEGRSLVIPGVLRISNWSGAGATYKIVRDGNLWSFRINGLEKRLLGDFEICWRRNLAAWFGEAYNIGSDIGGTNQNHHSVTVDRYRVDDNQTWYSPGWTVGSSCRTRLDTPYFCTNVASDAQDMWTNR